MYVGSHRGEHEKKKLQHTEEYFYTENYQVKEELIAEKRKQQRTLSKSALNLGPGNGEANEDENSENNKKGGRLTMAARGEPGSAPNRVRDMSWYTKLCDSVKGYVLVRSLYSVKPSLFRRVRRRGVGVCNIIEP